MKTKTILAALIFALGAAIALPAGAQDKPTDDPRMAGFNRLSKASDLQTCAVVVVPSSGPQSGGR